MPGRYSHNRDPELAELLHQITLDGWANDSTGDLGQDGFHASLLIVEPAEQSELTDAFDQPIPVGNWILTQDEHGVVTVDQYPTPQAARQAFTRLQEGGAPGSADGTDHPNWTARPPRRSIGQPAVQLCPCDCNGAAGAAAAGTQDAGCGETTQNAARRPTLRHRLASTNHGDDGPQFLPGWTAPAATPVTLGRRRRPARPPSRTEHPTSRWLASPE